MDELIQALLDAGAIDADTAAILNRQMDDEAARAWAEDLLRTSTQVGLMGQQERLLSLLKDADYKPTTARLDTFWRGENERLGRDMLPAIREVATERTATGAAKVASTGSAPDDVFDLINEDMLAWTDDYYINADEDEDNLGSLPSLNLTARTRFQQYFVDWQRGDLGGRPDGLPQLIEALTPIFGATRAETIAITETTRIFNQALLTSARRNPFTVALRFQTAMDERTCPICSPLANTIVGKREEGYTHPQQGAVGWPPLHVRCRCSIAEETANTLALAGQQVATTTVAQATEQASVLYDIPEETLTHIRELQNKAIERLAQRFKVTPEEFERTIDGAFKDLTKNDMAIQFHSHNLDALLADGRFKTQFETGTSGGTFKPDLRAEAERNGLGIPVDIDPRQRPIYGYVNLGTRAQKMVSQYGDITFIMRPELRDRTTTTMDDSLAGFRGREVAGMPINNTSRPAWDGHMSILYQYAKSGDIGDILDDIPYIEVQMHGGVSLSDVRGIIDRKNKLTQAQREQLQGLGIEILGEGD